MTPCRPGAVLAKKRHGGSAAIKLDTRLRPSTRSRASLHVQPTVVAPGGRVRVLGNAGRCPRGDTVFALSRAFAGRSFAGLGAITTRVRAHGSFSAAGHLRRNANRGRYIVSARCGGGNLGLTTHLRVT